MMKKTVIVLIVLILAAIVQQQIHQDVPVVFLYAPYSLPVFSKRIHGIEPSPAGIGWNSEHWFVPRGEQKYKVDAIAP